MRTVVPVQADVLAHERGQSRGVLAADRVVLGAQQVQGATHVATGAVAGRLVALLFLATWVIAP
ncbi:hypothetical protein [Nocardia sp. NPDC050710]|uniref:hypothetical protein n=1 Tax=Nocardia sp. NPDC050710 TaxID=3157220 RepID=UPI0033CEC304